MRCKPTTGIPKPTPAIHKSTPTPQELHAALKLIELLYINGVIPQHVYRNILTEYRGKDIDITSYRLDTAPEAV